MGTAEADRHAYLENQRMNNRITAQGYTAWDKFLPATVTTPALARRLQDALARRPGGANPRHRRARGHERDERHRQPRHRLRHHHHGRHAQRRRYRVFGRPGDDTAAADRDDLRAASARQRLERFHRDLDAVRRRRRQYVAAARCGFRHAHQIRPPGAARGRSRQCGVVARRRLARDAGAADRPHQCARRQRHRKIVAAGELEDRAEKARLLLADHGPPGVPVRRRRCAGRRRGR